MSPTNPFLLNLFLNSPVFLLTLTLGAYLLASWLYRRSRSFALFHPALTGAGVVAAVLATLNIDYQDYLQGNAILTFLLGTATVALGVPMYQQLPLIRQIGSAILITVIAGSLFAAAVAIAIAAAFGASKVTLLSLSTKSVTTPIAINVTEAIGGLASLAAACVVGTAILGIAIGPWLLNRLEITDDRIWGLTMGITAHAAGTARAFEINATRGAFSGLGMSLTGSFSAIVIPLAAEGIRALGY